MWHLHSIKLPLASCSHHRWCWLHFKCKTNQLVCRSIARYFRIGKDYLRHYQSLLVLFFSWNDFLSILLCHPKHFHSWRCKPIKTTFWNLNAVDITDLYRYLALFYHHYLFHQRWYRVNDASIKAGHGLTQSVYKTVWILSVLVWTIIYHTSFNSTSGCSNQPEIWQK